MDDSGPLREWYHYAVIAVTVAGSSKYSRPLGFAVEFLLKPESVDQKLG